MGRKNIRLDTSDIVPPDEDDKPPDVTKEDLAEIDVEIPVEEAKRRGALDAKCVAMNRRNKAGINRRRMGDKGVKWQGNPEDAYEGVSAAYGSTQAFVHLKRTLPSPEDLCVVPLGTYELWSDFDTMVREKYWTGEKEAYEWMIRQRGDYRAMGKFTLGEDPTRKVVWAQKQAEAREKAKIAAAGELQQNPQPSQDQQQIEALRSTIESMKDAMQSLASQRLERSSPPSFRQDDDPFEEDRDQDGNEINNEDQEDMYPPRSTQRLGPPPPPEPIMYYFTIQGSGNGSPLGPLDARSLCQQIYREMGAQSLPLVSVWSEGWPSWKPAGSVQEIVATFHAIVPPPVAAPAMPPWMGAAAMPPSPMMQPPQQQQEPIQQQQQQQPAQQQSQAMPLQVGNDRSLIEALIRTTKDTAQLSAYMTAMQQQIQAQAVQNQQMQQALVDAMSRIQAAPPQQMMMPTPNPVAATMLPSPAQAVAAAAPAAAPPDVLHQTADTIDAVEKIARKLGLGRAAAPAPAPISTAGMPDAAASALGGLAAAFPKGDEAAALEAAADEADPIKVIEGGPWRMAYYRKTGQPVSFLESVFLNMDNVGEMLGKIGDRVEKARVAMAEGEMAQRRKLMLDRAMQKLDETEAELAEKERALEAERMRAAQLERDCRGRMLAQQNIPPQQEQQVPAQAQERPQPPIEQATAAAPPPQQQNIPPEPQQESASIFTSMRGLGF